MKTIPTCIDLFSGCGGFSLGFINAGWNVVAALDANIVALQTYYCNLCDEDTKLIGDFSRKDMDRFENVRREWRQFDMGGYEAAHPGFRKAAMYYANQKWIFRDMLPGAELEWVKNAQPHYERDEFPAVSALFYKKAQDITGYEILDSVRDVVGDEQIGCVCGGPPCQGFSRMNNKRHSRDTRNFLIFEFGRLVMEINPKTFVMENVPNMINMNLPDGRNLLETFQRMVNKKDWDVYYEVQGLYLDGNMDPEGECTVVIQQEKKSVQAVL